MDETTDSCEFTANEKIGTRCSGCGILIAPKHYHHCGCPHEECPNCWRPHVRCECEVQALRHDDVIKEIE